MEKEIRTVQTNLWIIFTEKTVIVGFKTVSRLQHNLCENWLFCLQTKLKQALQVTLFLGYARHEIEFQIIIVTAKLCVNKTNSRKTSQLCNSKNKVYEEGVKSNLMHCFFVAKQKLELRNWPLCTRKGIIFSFVFLPLIIVFCVVFFIFLTGND